MPPKKRNRKMKKINYYDVATATEIEEKNLTPSEYASRMGDLRMMENGGHVSAIHGQDEED